MTPSVRFAIFDENGQARVVAPETGTAGVAGSTNDYRGYIFGNKGGDRLFGGDGADQISGGNSRDRVNGGRGTDTVRSGNARDVVKVRDGETDTVECGGGEDRVIADAADNLSNCENVKRR